MIRRAPPGWIGPVEIRAEVSRESLNHRVVARVTRLVPWQYGWCVRLLRYDDDVELRTGSAGEPSGASLPGVVRTSPPRRGLDFPRRDVSHGPHTRDYRSRSGEDH